MASSLHAANPLDSPIPGHRPLPEASSNLSDSWQGVHSGVSEPENGSTALPADGDEGFSPLSISSNSVSPADSKEPIRSVAYSASRTQDVVWAPTEEIAAHRLYTYSRAIDFLKTPRVWAWNLPLILETLAKIIYEVTFVVIKALGEKVIGYHSFVDSERHYVVLKCQAKSFMFQLKGIIRPSILIDRNEVAQGTENDDDIQWGTELDNRGTRMTWFVPNYYRRSIDQQRTAYFTHV